MEPTNCERSDLSELLRQQQRHVSRQGSQDSTVVEQQVSHRSGQAVSHATSPWQTRIDRIRNESLSAAITQALATGGTAGGRSSPRPHVHAATSSEIRKVRKLTRDAGRVIGSREGKRDCRLTLVFQSRHSASLRVGCNISQDSTQSERSKTSPSHWIASTSKTRASTPRVFMLQDPAA